MKYPYLVTVGSDLYVHRSNIGPSMMTGKPHPQDLPAFYAEVQAGVGHQQKLHIVLHGSLAWNATEDTISLGEYGIFPSHVVIT